MPLICVLLHDFCSKVGHRSLETKSSKCSWDTKAALTRLVEGYSWTSTAKGVYLQGLQRSSHGVQEILGSGCIIHA